MRGEPTPPAKYYAAESRLAPIPDRVPQIWFGSWSDRRLAAIAAVADGWFASAHNATPNQYREAHVRLDDTYGLRVENQTTSPMR